MHLASGRVLRAKLEQAGDLVSQILSANVIRAPRRCTASRAYIFQGVPGGDKLGYGCNGPEAKAPAADNEIAQAIEQSIIDFVLYERGHDRTPRTDESFLAVNAQ